jgi:16S rRNA (cytosine967-C5)-methyltransferase
LYQLRFLTRIPASAAVNESVKLVCLARLRSAQGFVNAVLRRSTREPDYDPVDALTEKLDRIALETSHPRWLIERWNAAFGLSETEAFARANNEVPPIAFRIVETRASAGQVFEKLSAAGAELHPSRVARGAWRVNGAHDVVLKLSREGKVYIQDEASQLVAQVLDAQPGERILDLCAAPGSKTTLIAAKLHLGGVVVAGDFYPHRMSTVIQTARLHGLLNIEPLILNGLLDLPFENACFDRVLVDAPCSGTGTLRHNPEIRYRISAEDIQDLSVRQQKLLQNAARVLKVGGRLVYSTCSVETEENEGVIRAFLRENENFESVHLAVDEGLMTSPGMLRTWPHHEGTDGFFIAALERK